MKYEEPKFELVELEAIEIISTSDDIIDINL